MSPSDASRELFLAARACPRSLSTRRAPSRSPPDSSSAFFTSIMPAAVSSRSCFIFSIALAKPLSLLVLSRRRLLGSLGLGVVLRSCLGLRRVLGVRLVGGCLGLLDLGRWTGLGLGGLDGRRVDRGLGIGDLRYLTLRRRSGLWFRGLRFRGLGRSLCLFGLVRFAGGRFFVLGLGGFGASVGRLCGLLGDDPLGDILGDLCLLDDRRQRAVGGRDCLLAASLHDRVAYEARDQGYGPDRVVVAGDDVVHDLGVAVGVGEGYDRYLEAVGLLDQELLALGVYDEDGTGQALHLGYPGEVAPQLLVLAVQREPVLARALLLRRLLDPPREVLEVLDARQDGLEVRQDAAYVALGDVGLAAAQGLLGDRDLGLLLGADEEDLAVRLGDPAHEVEGALEERERLIQVYDVHPRPLGEDVSLHLRVPTLGLMPEVNPGFEQLRSEEHT